jgi:hypothetical protein
VNLFSLCCSALTVSGLQLLARRCGAARWAASLGALCFAASAGFWFYSGYAKHDAFSGLLFLITLHLILSLRTRPTKARLVVTAVVGTLGLGSSWPLMMVLAPLGAYVIFKGRRRIGWRAAVSAVGVALVLMVALGGFVMLRASADPAINWGYATNVPRLVQLLDRYDFLPHKTAPPASAGAKTADREPTRLPVLTAGAAPAGPLGFFASMFVRELGVVAILLAVLGLVSSVRRRPRSLATWPLVTVFMVNLLVSAGTVGSTARPGLVQTLRDKQTGRWRPGRGDHDPPDRRPLVGGSPG